MEDRCDARHLAAAVWCCVAEKAHIHALGPATRDFSLSEEVINWPHAATTYVCSRMARVPLYLVVWRRMVRSLGQSRKAGISLLRKDAKTILGTSASPRTCEARRASKNVWRAARGLADENDEGALSPQDLEYHHKKRLISHHGSDHCC